MRMLGTNVLIAETKKEEKTQGGIILTGGPVSKASQPGLVLAVGPDVVGLEAGDRCFLQWEKAMPIDHDNKQAVIVQLEFVRAAF